jgi:hypothetical protein
LARTRDLAGLVDRGEEGGGVEGSIQQHKHARAEQGQQLPGQGGFVSVRRRAEDGPEDASSAGLDQGHHPQRGIAREAHPVADPTQP